MFKSLVLSILAGSLSFAVAHADTLQVGAYPGNPPWEYKNEQSEFEGFEVDLVKAIATKLGDDIEFQDLGFQALFAATSSGRIDMAISTITITNERLENQSFTQGYYDSDLALLTTKDGKKNLVEMRDQPVGVLSNSVAESWVNAHRAEIGFTDVRGYTDQQNVLLDLRAGRISGAVGDIAGYQFAIKQAPNLVLRDRIATGDRFGIMMPKSSPRLEEVNKAISDLKQDGTLASLHEKWFGAAPDKGTSTITILDLPVAK